MRRSLSILILSVSVASECEIVQAGEGPFCGKMVFFGANKVDHDVASIFTWSPEMNVPVEVLSFPGYVVLSGRTSPDGRLLSVTLASTSVDGRIGARRVIVIDSSRECREIGRDFELVAWYPDSARVLCRGGEKYDWIHTCVEVSRGTQHSLPINSQDAAMDVSKDGTIAVMKGRPGKVWQRSPGDFYPKRQLYHICASGFQCEPFTSEAEDCIWWRFKPSGTGGIYYRRHYHPGVPVETAMVRKTTTSSELIDFTALGVRPSGLPTWRPDGREIAWIVSRAAPGETLKFELMLQPVSGGNPRFISAEELGLSWFGKIDWR